MTHLDLPPGDYAIVEILGHRTLIGRVSEVERFGTKLLQIEPLFGSDMLDPVLIGGGSIYQFTSCSAEAAWNKRPTQDWALPESIRSTLPAPMIEHMPAFLLDDANDDDWGEPPLPDDQLANGGACS